MLKRAAASKGVMGSLVGTGVGAAAYFATAKLAPKVTFLQGRWWATPTAMIVAGHILKRYSQESGQAVVGAGGAMLAMSYSMQAPAAKATKATAGYGSTPYLQAEAGSDLQPYGSTAYGGQSGYASLQGEAGRAYGDAGALSLGPGRNSRNFTRAGEAGALVT